MKRITGARVLIVFAVLCAFSGFLLRLAFRNSGSAWELIVVSVLAAAVFLAAAICLKKTASFRAVFQSSLPDLILSLFGAAAFAVGGLLGIAEAGASRIFGIGAIVAAAALALAALFRKSGKAPRAAAYTVVVIFYIAKLFYDFRRWMHDPSVLDYCFLLFASISFMIATYHAALFCYNRGKRGVMAFFSLCGIYFGMVSLPDLRSSELLLYAGGILWMLACGWQALRNVKEEET